MKFLEQSLCQHVQVISTQIASRLAASVTERSTAYYVQSCLASYGLESQRQNFYTIERFSKRLTPQFALSAAAIGAGLAASKSSWRWLAGGLGLALSWHYARLMRGEAALWESSLADDQSRNVICKLAPVGEVKKRVVIAAHLDTGFSRLSHYPPLLTLTKSLLGVAGLATIAGSLLTLWDDQHEFSKTLRVNIAGSLMLASLLAALDEFSLPVTGANDNASGIAVALALAEQLTIHPLQETEVWMVFAGAEAVGGAGMNAFLDSNAASLKDAYALVLKGVGIGDICWVTEHQLSSTVSYESHPAAAAWAEKAASHRPELGVMGRAMMGLDEVGILRAYGLKAVALRGVDRLTGHTPHLYQPSDTLDKIDGQALLTTAELSWEMLQQLDQSAL